MKERNTQNSFIRAIKKFFYSAFVSVTFLLYALENRGTPAVSSVSATNGATSTPSGAAAAGRGFATGGGQATGGTSIGRNAASGSAASSGYKDGTYTGSEVNVRWGYVQVQATIQNGQITNVQFLEYPNERNTSVRINSTAVPALQQEAIQAQSANVNIITGATLTSEGFQQSLQAALAQAKAWEVV